jgi:plastocyanin
MLTQLAHRPAAAVLTVAVVPLPLQVAAHHPKRHRHHLARHERAHPAPLKRHDPRVRPQDPVVKLNPRSSHAAAPGAKHVDWRITLIARPARRSRDVRPQAHSARDPAATISDFKFSPGTLTIHVGDTVTWTNAGPSEHTATARNGSFDTGPLRKGASASHTFTQSGTFAYFCAIHPFMHGTILVEAASGGSQAPAGSGASTTATTTSTSTSTTSAPTAAGTSTGSTTHESNAATLPNTGLDLGLTLLSALALLVVGVGIRRLVSQDARGSGE